MLTARRPLVALAVLAPCLAIVASTIGAAAVSASAAGSQAYSPKPTYRAHDYSHGEARAIVPPGENGLVNAAQAVQFEATGARPANSNDELTKYQNLIYAPKHLKDGQLGKYFVDESFGVRPSNITRTEHPSSTEPVVIYRDKSDIPHIYGKTLDAAAYGAGYAQAEDRLFFMDVLRHFGQGTVSSFIGPSCGDEQMDHDQLLIAPYSAAQAEAQLKALPSEYGAIGTRTLHFVNNYSKGVNAFITATQTNPSLLPADYAAAVGPPQPWKPSDTMFVGAVIGGQLGKGGGGEVGNAALLDYLQHKLGKAAGTKAFTDFKEQNDPDAPTTIDHRAFAYDIPHHVNPKLTAMPDNPSTPLKGGPTDTTSGCAGVASTLAAAQAQQALVKFPSKLSNALLVGAKDSRSGHPLAVFGPQTGYFAPEIWSQEDIHAPHYQASGASVPGTGLVEIGRGEDYAWSATSATSDIVDQRLEKICKPGGGKPAAEGKYYEFRGKCRPMKAENFSETAFTKPGGLGDPVQLNHTIYQTRHGVIQGWTKAHHKPVAVVNQRSTLNHELDSGTGFMRWADPALNKTPKQWMKGAADIGYTFNWLYLDNKNIAEFTSGADPIRNPHVDPNLPTWGTGNSEWRGMLPASKHPHQIDPKDNMLVSWNNKPARKFSAADNTFSYGPLYRSQTLTEAIHQQLREHHGKINRADLVDAMRVGASADFDGRELVPALATYLHHRSIPARDRTMLRLLSRWAHDGALRIKAKPSAHQYQHHAAIAIMDELEPRLIETMFNPIFKAGGVGSFDGANDRYDVVPMEWVNTPNNDDSRLGSAYDDAGWAGQELKVLEELSHRHVGMPFAPSVMAHICGSGESACFQHILGALSRTYKAMVNANGSTKAKTWKADTATKTAGESMPAFDAIGYRAIGLVGQPNVDWQNRPTFQQVISFPAHRR